MSFLSKAMGAVDFEQTNYRMESLYWVELPAWLILRNQLINFFVKTSKWLLIPATILIWIISFIKIKKTDDKILKKKKTKKTIIIASILIFLIALTRFLSQLL